MPARVTMLRFQPEKAEEGISLLATSVAPSIKQQKGLKGLVLMTDPATGRAATLTLWETEADMKAAETGNYPQQIAKLAGLLAGPPAREVYDQYELSF